MPEIKGVSCGNLLERGGIQSSLAFHATEVLLPVIDAGISNGFNFLEIA